ncbi:transmembrane protein, putative (macronuclear) [Tetrahymena thermophila SB210]|uniref:Transmembrane protein, putative n=1 Tax=Tetrahymena thermophila (strain SB210) TaxID=312017 RepID=I7M6T9_TETTS|nr:transmembrane protein, putative [Tetrahymena thermophila SB210]EAR86111.1 transmembrane protein, putative [Tetrahymena thermophila SB210]|eukprot:XP_976706.1 transmembrane protein, putative [Tetrahymena thermophila SB210]
MNNSKRGICLTFAAFIFLCSSYISCQSDVISLPLKINKSDQLVIPSKFGSKSQCEIELLPLIGYCSNVITQSKDQSKTCGATAIGQNSFVQGQEYVTKFQLGNLTANLNFTNPDSKSSFYGEQALCFGSIFDNQQDNIIQELASQGVIQQQQFFVNVNSTNSTKGVVGSIDVGSPNLSLIKKGQKFVQLKHYNGNSDYSTPSDFSLKYGDLKLNYGTVAGFDLYSPYISIGIFQLNSIVKQIQDEGIQYEYHCEQSDLSTYKFNVDSIEKLKDISLNLIATSGQPFKITLKPQQYTRKQENGKYQVLLFPLIYSSYISLGYTVLQSYYVGFDVPSQSYLISEKIQTNINQF